MYIYIFQRVVDAHDTLKEHLLTSPCCKTTLHKLGSFSKEVEQFSRYLRDVWHIRKPTHHLEVWRQR